MHKQSFLNLLSQNGCYVTKVYKFLFVFNFSKAQLFVPRETENNAYAKVCGESKVYLSKAGPWLQLKLRSLWSE